MTNNSYINFRNVDANAVIDTYKAHTVEETAKIYNISKYAVGKIAKEQSFSKKAHKENLSRELADSYRSSNLWSAKDIAYVHDVTEGAVRYAIKKYGGRIKPNADAEVLEGEYIASENSQTRKPGFWKRAGTYIATAAAGLVLLAGGLAYTAGCNPEKAQAQRSSSAAALEQKVAQKAYQAPAPAQAAEQRKVVSDTKTDSLRLIGYDTDKDGKKDSTDIYNAKGELIGKSKPAVEKAVQLPKPSTLERITDSIVPSAGAADIPQYKQEPKPAQKYAAPINTPKRAEAPKPVVSKQKKSENDYVNSVIASEVASAKKDIEDNLRKKSRQPTVSSLDNDSGFYGQAGFLLGDETSMPLEFGYKTKDWGAALFAESGEYGAKAGLFDLTEAELDLGIAGYGGDASGFSGTLGKDFIFGKEKDWNLRPEVGAYNFRAGEEKVSGANANLMLQKKCGNWVFSAGVNANSDENVGNFGGLLTISYGGGLGNCMTHISGLGGLEDRIIESRSGSYDQSTGQGGSGSFGGDGNGGDGDNNPGDVSPGVPSVTDPSNPNGHPTIPPVTDPSNPNGHPTIPPEVPPTAP
jgi:hypothetical protein